MSSTSLTKEQLMTPFVHCTTCRCLSLCIVLLVQDMIMNQEQQWWQLPLWNVFCSKIKKNSSYLSFKINLSQFFGRSPVNYRTYFRPFLRLSKHTLAQTVKTTNEITRFRKYWGSQNGKSASSLCVIPGGHKCGCVVPPCSPVFPLFYYLLSIESIAP